MARFHRFVPKLRDFVEGRLDEMRLQSVGSAMPLVLRRDEPGWYRWEVSFEHGHNGNTVRFKMWEESLAKAVPAAEAIVARIRAGASWGWLPQFRSPDTKPRAALLQTDQSPSQFGAWSPAGGGRRGPGVRI